MHASKARAGWDVWTLLLRRLLLLLLLLLLLALRDKHMAAYAHALDLEGKTDAIVGACLCAYAETSL